MSDDAMTQLDVLQTGVPNLDLILGGGIPVGSFNLVSGGPGAGKTILTQQLMFHNASPEREVLHFTVLGEPVAKLLRYQSRFSYFDPEKISTSIRFIDIGDVIRKEGLQRGLDVIADQVERHSPGLVFIDSVRAVREISLREGEYSLRTFTHDLAQVAVVWNTTSFLIGQYEQSELKAGAEFTMADGILWLDTVQVDNSVVRKIQIVKSRGMNVVLGRHSFRINSDGCYVYPRLEPVLRPKPPDPPVRASWGIAALDQMTGGGVPQSETFLVTGSTGTGKSTIGQFFIADGLRRGETCVVVTFEETPEEFLRRADAFGLPFRESVEAGTLHFLEYPPANVTVDQVIDETSSTIRRAKATRLVFDSVSGFELARAPTDLASFRATFYRLVQWLRGQNVAVVMTNEVPETFGEPRLSTHGISFIADNILLLRQIEIQSELRTVLVVVKMRHNVHSHEIREYQITSSGITVGRPFQDYSGVLAGMARITSDPPPKSVGQSLESEDSELRDL